MGSSVRSVTVRLDAMVAEYERKMKRAGDTTEKTFDRVHASTSRAREEFVATQRATDRLETSTARLSSTTNLVVPSQRRLATEVDRVSVAAVRGSASIDKYSGRMRVLLDLAATTGPALLALGAGGVVALTGLAGVFGAATVGALGMVGAVQGVGDAIKAVEKARLEPTVENLQAAREAMAQIGPDAQKFVTRFQELGPLLRDLRDAGAAGLFPGVNEALDSGERLLPVFRELAGMSGRAGGAAIAASAESLASGRWRGFWEFLVDEVPEGIDRATRLVGALSHAGAEMWMAFDPTNDRFVDWLVDVSTNLDRWASSREGREDIRSFLAYAEKTGPKVGEFFVAVADALTQITQAAAPLSGPVLDSLTAVSKVVAAVADSDLGTPILAGVAALTLYNRALQVTAALQTRVTGSTALSGALASGGMWGATVAGARGLRAATPGVGQFGLVVRDLGQSSRYASEQTLAARAAVRGFANQASRGVAPIAGLAIATTDAADGFSLANTASLGLMGWGVGGPIGAAIGSGIGLVTDITSATRSWADTVQRAKDAIEAGDLQAQAAELERYEERLVRLKDTNETTGLGDFFDDIWSMQLWNEGMDIDGQIRDVERGIQALKTVGTITPGTGLQRLQYDLAGAAEQSDIAADALKSFTTQYANLNAILTKQGQWDAYQAAIDNLTASIEENGQTLDSNTEKGRQNREALNQIAETGARVSENMVGLERQQFLRGLIAQFKTSAEAAGGMDRRARDVKRSLRELMDVNPKPKIEVKDGPALSSINAVESRLNSIPDQDVWINIRERTAGGPSAAAMEERMRRGDPVVPKPKKKADGGTIPWGGGRAIRSAEGSTVPDDGGPYVDRFPYLLAPGEEVISNRHGQADRWRPLLKAINAGRLASGGTVSSLNLPRQPIYTTPTLQTAADREAKLVGLSLKQLRHQLKLSEKSVEAERQQRDDLVSRRDSLVSGVRTGLDRGIWKPNTGSVWAEGSGDPNAWLRNDIGGIDQFDALTGRLKKVLSGPALEAILAEGDVATAQAYAGLDDATLREYQRLYGVKQQRLTDVSGMVGDTFYKEGIDKAVAQLVRSNNRLDRIEKAIDRSTASNSAEQSATRAESKKGAGKAAKDKPRGQVPKFALGR